MESTKITSRQTRIDWIDIAKGLGILCVLFGHFKVGSVSLLGFKTAIPNYLINSFHMPLFFFLSGYCFSKRSVKFKDFTIKKFIGLMIPYITFSAIWVVYESLLALRTGEFSILLLAHEVKIYLLQTRVHAIWFLPCMFVMELVFYWVQKLTKDNIKLISIIGIVITIIGILYRKFVDIDLIWNVDVILTMLTFFIVGYVVKSNNLIKSNSKVNTTVLFIIFSILNVVLNTINIKFFEPHSTSVYGDDYCNYILYYASALLGILAIVELSKLLEGKVKFVKYIGANTLVYFGLHQIIYYTAQKVLDHFELSNGMLWVSYFAIMIVSIIVLTLFNELLTRTKLRALLGKGIIKKD